MPQSAHRKHAFLVKTKEKAKSNKIEPRMRVTLELLHHILGHRSTISLMAGDTANGWKDIEIRIYPDYPSRHEIGRASCLEGYIISL